LRSVGIFLLLSLLFFSALLSLHHGLDFEFKVFSLLLGLVSLVGQDLLDDLLDLGLDVSLLGVAVDDLHERAVLFFDTEGLEPAGEGVLLLVKRYKTIHQGGDGVVLTDLLCEALTKGSLVDRRLDIFDVEHEGLLIFVSVVEVTTISSAEALVDRAIKPHHGIEATSCQFLWGIFLSGRLD
jgi:hypothetical protein